MWTTLRMEVATPLFNDGADGDAGVRVPSLRGAMRFWFRALAGIGVGADLDALAAIEAAVFGDTEASSPVRFRIPQPPTPTAPGTPDWCDNSGGLGQWMVYLMGQGLAEMRRNEATRRYDSKVNRSYVAAGTPFDLQLCWRKGCEDEAALALAALWLLCTYGGAGARTRRGYGGLRIISHQGPLPGPWDAESIRSPSVAYYQSITRLWPGDDILGRIVPVLNALAGRRKIRFSLAAAWAGGNDRPTYPVLSKRYTAVGVSGGEPFGDWPDVLAHAGEQMRWFRADRDTPGVPYRPEIKTREWLDVVNGGATHFAVGALGLPVNFRGNTVAQPATRHGGSRGELRRASPLWLRPVCSDGQWRLLSFAFLTSFLPSDVDVQLWHGTSRGKTVTVTETDVEQATKAWIDAMSADASFVRHRSIAARRRP